MDERNNDGFIQAIKSRMDQLIDEIIEDHFTLSFDGNPINGKNYLNKNEIIKDFIDIKRLKKKLLKWKIIFMAFPSMIVLEIL